MYDGIGVYDNDSPIAYWNFNNIENNTAIDLTGNGYNGVIFGDPEVTGDIPHQMGMPEDDSNYSIHMYDWCFVDIPGQGLPGGSDPVTLEAWFYRDHNTNETQYIMS